MSHGSNDPVLADALLNAMERHIIPKTRQGVSRGNKVFGAALLWKSDYSVFLAETNNEVDSPLWHGETHTLKKFYEITPRERPDTKDLLFLSTHEPCSMCLSAITWCGFDNFYYFFSHEDSRDSFSIPHDLRILKEVFTLDPGGYRRSNAYWQGHSIRKLIEPIPGRTGEELKARADEIARQYESLSGRYQEGKESNSIPLN